MNFGEKCLLFLTFAIGEGFFLGGSSYLAVLMFTLVMNINGKEIKNIKEKFRNIEGLKRKSNT